MVLEYSELDSEPLCLQKIEKARQSRSRRFSIVVLGSFSVKGKPALLNNFSFFFYIIYSLLRYKKSHGALAMAKTKPKIQNELTKEKSGTTLFNWGPYRAQAHTRARH